MPQIRMFFATQGLRRDLRSLTKSRSRRSSRSVGYGETFGTGACAVRVILRPRGCSRWMATMLTSPSIQVMNLAVTRGARRILAGMTWEVQGPGVTAIFGPGAAGKSTFVHAIAGAFDAATDAVVHGTVLVDGAAADSVLVRLVSQRTANMMQPLVEVLAGALPDRSSLTRLQQRETLVRLLRASEGGLLAPRLDEPFAMLPMGMRRLAGLLMADWSSAPVLALDEPTAGLDEDAAAPILDAIARLGRERRVLFVTHNQRHARQLASDVILLASGQLVEAGPADLFFASPTTPQGQQFVRTGGCTLPGLDTAADDLAEEWQVPESTGVAPVIPPRDSLHVRVETSPSPEATEHERILQAAQTRAEVPSTPGRPVVWDAEEWERSPSHHSHVTRLSSPDESGAPAFGLRNEVPLAQPRVDTTPDVLAPVERTWVSESRGPRDFFWVRPGRLGGAPRPGIVASLDDDLAALERVGITLLISLTTSPVPAAPLLAHGIRGVHAPVRDMHAPTFEDALQVIRNAEVEIRAGGVVAYHCRAGLGRTGTLLAAHLIWTEGLSGDEALAAVRVVNPRYVQSELQVRFLREFGEWIRSVSPVPAIHRS